MGGEQADVENPEHVERHVGEVAGDKRLEFAPGVIPALEINGTEQERTLSPAIELAKITGAAGRTGKTDLN